VGTLTRRALTSGARLVLSASDPRHWPRRPPVRAFALGGMHPHELERLPATVPRNGAPFTVASVGRLLGWKGFALGVRAFARLHHERPESRYWIIGDGPERRPLESLAQRLGCAQAVTFLGWLPRENVLHRLETADALLHPSLHEQFGYVMLEAMALGVPVVCLRAAGAAMLVDDDSGIRVAAREPDQTVDALHAALHRLASDAPVRRRLGDGARERARVHWAWPAVGRRLLALYDEVRGARP
jgi:glycosyltransferase involved in cell wall biosynthesis